MTQVGEYRLLERQSRDLRRIADALEGIVRLLQMATVLPAHGSTGPDEEDV